jgi:hypothetical protein
MTLIVYIEKLARWSARKSHSTHQIAFRSCRYAHKTASSPNTSSCCRYRHHCCSFITLCTKSRTNKSIGKSLVSTWHRHPLPGTSHILGSRPFLPLRPGHMAINWELAIFTACSANNPQSEGFSKMLGSAALIALSLCGLSYHPPRKLATVSLIFWPFSICPQRAFFRQPKKFDWLKIPAIGRRPKDLMLGFPEKPLDFTLQCLWFIVAEPLGKSQL